MIPGLGARSRSGISGHSGCRVSRSAGAFPWSLQICSQDSDGPGPLSVLPALPRTAFAAACEVSKLLCVADATLVFLLLKKKKKSSLDALSCQLC